MSVHATNNPDDSLPSSRSDSPTEINNPTRTALSAYEIEGDGRPPFVLSVPELKLLGIAGVGFFLDAYDLFIINPVATMLQFRLYGGDPLPSNLEGFMKAGANIGSVIGQFGFGFAADYYGRKAVYGKELVLIIFATIMCLTTPTGQLSPASCLIYLAIWRIVLGVGVGGDYPMSASVSTDRAHLRRRGVLLSYIFANQGWGSLVGSLATIIVLACYKSVMSGGDHTSKLDGVWRIVVGLSLIPAFGTLYQRLTLPESKRYEESRRNHDDEETIEALKEKQAAEEAASQSTDKEKKGASVTTTAAAAKAKDIADAKKNHFAEFFAYFSEWRHLKILLGTTLSWFFLDIAFYGINLNQNVVLQQIGFDGSGGTPWERLFDIGIGNLIVTALGFVPGYYATVLTIEYLGRKWIQIQGFLLEALFLGILAVLLQFRREHYDILLSRRSLPYQVPRYCSRYLCCKWQGRSHHLRASVQQFD
ncbi:unnamed protein product [Somion occarium]|uniref:Major facilitator superfamily (MFS) profile domain-containing protein n=1 Tax=Somion occarium TaxID=3059160 RepID=A0ABP1E164_9APHY